MRVMWLIELTFILALGQVYTSRVDLIIKPVADGSVGRRCVECKQDFVTRCDKVDISPDDVRRAQTITLPDGTIYSKIGEPYSGTDDYKTFSFESDNDDEIDITVPARGDGDITAFFKDKDQLYFIGNCNGIKLWITVDGSNLEQAHAPLLIDSNDEEDRFGNALPRYSLVKEAALLRKGKETDEQAVISIKMYITEEYAANTGDVKQSIANLIATVNEAFANSDINITMKLHCIEKVTFPEEGTPKQMLYKLADYKRDLKTVLGGADMAHLMIEGDGRGGVLGIAFVSHYRPLGVTKKYGAQTAEIFAHEIGHNFGGGHDDNTLEEQGNDPVYSYGKAYLLPNSKKLTILSYKQGGWTNYINYFSSPYVRDKQGHLVGDASHDNRKVIQENRFLMSEHGDESGACEYGDGSDLTPTTTPSPKNLFFYLFGNQRWLFWT